MNTVQIILIAVALSVVATLLLLVAYDVRLPRTVKFLKWGIGSVLALYLMWGQWILMSALAIPLGWLLLPALFHHRPLPYPRWLDWAFWLIVSAACFIDTLSRSQPSQFMLGTDVYLAWAFCPINKRRGLNATDATVKSASATGLESYRTMEL
jgi:hypothetical protein